MHHQDDELGEADAVEEPRTAGSGGARRSFFLGYLRVSNRRKHNVNPAHLQDDELGEAEAVEELRQQEAVVRADQLVRVLLVLPARLAAAVIQVPAQ